ncbi:serine hydrolase domain-containing protein, partial [Rhodohalobacter sp.]|uniref:serine hydrolase domain-containing protein n=1 Tax=Rhodohalobacter sp. TaxID=1974210 RepID=UPI0035685901
MKLKLILFGLIILILKSCAGLEQLSHNLETDATLPDVDAVVQDEIIKQNIPGAAVAVVQNGRIVHINGYGHTSLDRTEEVDIDHVFRWASISKPLTAVALLQLDEQYDDFSIDDKVSDYVSYWPDSGQKGDITIKQLLSHRAGITHYTTKRNCPDNNSPSHNTGAHGAGPFSVEDAVEIFEDEDLCFEPGSSYKYSTYGYTLAAAVFEEVSGESYADWVMDNIAQPTFMMSLQQATGTSEGYNISGGRLVDRS